MLFLGKPAFAALALPAFDEVLDAESAACAALFRVQASMPDPLAARLSGVTSALVFAHFPSALVERLALLGVRSILRQDPFPSGPIPIVDYHLSLFADLAFTAEERVPRVDTSGSAHRSAERATALHPGSGSAHKNWPAGNFADLARRLASERERVWWIIGPAEEGMTLPADARVWRDPDLGVLAASLSRCRLFVGNDSGVTHLAAACGCPTVVLFGGSDPRVWMPRGGRVRAVQSRSMERISVDRVLIECTKLGQ
jgi:hypothetical protein